MAPKLEPPILVPSTKETLPKIIEAVAEKVIRGRHQVEAILFDRTFEDQIVKIAEDDKPDEHSNNRRVFVRLIFDLVKDVVAEIFKVETDQQNPPWMLQKPLTKNKLTLAKNENILIQIVKREVMVAFSHEKRSQKENMIIRWSQKKRDRVDQVLVRELHTEEPSWTNYEDDEAQVKCDLSNVILDSLITDTVQAFKKIMHSH